MNRPSRDDFWFGLAAQYATRATCPRASIGAVLVKFDRLVSAGFNGAGPGEPHCLERDQSLAEHMAIDHCTWSRHAERNALRNAWINVEGSTIYVVGPRPVCPNCRDRLRENGVTDIRHRESVPTLDRVLAEVVDWQRSTFWPPSITDAPSTVKHIRREVDELWANPTDAMEMADVLILLVRLADNTGVDLTAAVAAKLAINRTRVWLPPDEHGITEHIRDERSEPAGKAVS